MLAGCEVPAPEGAFLPNHDAGAPADAGKRDARVTLPDSGAHQDAGADLDAEGTAGADAGDDAELGISGAAQARRAALSGRYLMRFDTFSSASYGSGFTALELHSRTSLLLIAELAMNESGLDATERVCNQLFEHACRKGCTSATSVLDQAVIDDFLLTRFFTRGYQLDENGTITGAASTIRLGYDDDAGGAVPTRTSDARVWDVVSGGVREGFLTQLTVNTALGAVSCSMYGAADFRATFQGTLDDSAGAPAFPEMTPALDGSNAVVLGASSSTCSTQQQQGPDAVEHASVRLARYGDALSDQAFWSCPSQSVFDQMLPPEAL